MLRSSDCVAHLAAALAKAQAELTNPQKSLTATLEPDGRGGGQSYRYAPLSAGLEIIRKTLGRHDLAVIQATDLDEEREQVVLTTTLVHASGQWIAARWPVCPTSSLGQPKLMGAALTYARRYSLFALVGIAGEDDLDAPDLSRPVPETLSHAPPELKPVQVHRSRTAVRVRGRVTGATQAKAPAPAGGVPAAAAARVQAPSPADARASASSSALLASLEA